jgi:hypothetical protein
MSNTTGAGKSNIHDPRFTAAIDLLGRTGAKNFRVGYTREEDGEPVVWYAVCEYKRPAGTAVWHKPSAEAAAAMDPLNAVLRLCEILIDGGRCNHCGQNTIFDPDMPVEGVVSKEVMDDLLDKMGCRYHFDPKTSKFVKSCNVYAGFVNS